jgi:pimeloyl-ACP methyl ester carboxylesterase
VTDLVLPRRFCAARLQTAIPHAEVVVLPGVGHVAMVDNHPLVAETIVAFAARSSSFSKPELDSGVRAPSSTPET